MNAGEKIILNLGDDMKIKKKTKIATERQDIFKKICKAT